MKIISPSLLSLDFKNLIRDINILNNIGVNRLHLDVMDGHFVPHLTFGPMIIKTIRSLTKSHLETHLMIENPMDTIDQYIEAGSDTIIIHYEASNNPIKELSYIRNSNLCAGIAINPDTHANVIKELLEYLDYILIMSVYPGRGGQVFINDSINKMIEIKKICTNHKIKLAVDGGVNLDTINKIYKTGIDIVIAGSAIFNSKDNIQNNYNNLLNA
tara:strand:- start:732 stop:1376 length:645 start_codon:yes stop_codon:yes gene_type:complete